MASVVLRTEDCLLNWFLHETLSFDHPLRSTALYHKNPNPNIIKPKSSNDFSSSRRRKRSPVGFQSNSRRQSESLVAKPPGKNLVMGQVKILKRGETLIAAAEKTDRGGVHGSRGEEEFDLDLGSTNRLGPDPKTMEKQIKLKEFKIGGGLYAGSASFVSPPPTSLPVPGFLGSNARVLACVVCGRLKSALLIASRSGSVADVPYVAHQEFEFTIHGITLKGD